MPEKVLTRGPERHERLCSLVLTHSSPTLEKLSVDWVALRFFSPTNLEGSHRRSAEAKDGASWCSVTRVTGRL